MYFKQFFDEKLAQYAYLIGCQKTGEAVIIDPMRDIEQYIDHAAQNKLTIVAATDTHIHADYISGLREFAERGVKVYASDEGDADWKYEWLINSPDGKYNYELMKDGDSFKVGNVKIEAWHTPGHTPEHLTFKIIDGAVADEPMGLATGDFVFVGDVGRPDLLESAAGMENVMEPSARTLFKTIEKFKEIPDYVQIWPGHGAGSACGKALGAIPESTAGYERRYNASLKAASSEDNFVKFILEGQPEPPIYFARMKRDNKIGPAIIGGLPSPKRVTVKELAKLAKQDGVAVLDTRLEPDFMQAHIEGSLLVTLNKQFNTVAGSFVNEDEDMYLIVDESRLTEAVRDLYRIGMDRVVGYVTLEDLKLYQEQGGELASTEVITFEEAVKRADTGSNLLDVRKRSEFENEGRLAGAMNIAHTRVLQRMNEVPNDKPLVVHCAAGGRSAAAGSLLKRAGYDVSVVMDSFPEFREKNAELTEA